MKVVKRILLVAWIIFAAIFIFCFGIVRLLPPFALPGIVITKEGMEEVENQMVINESICGVGAMVFYDGKYDCSNLRPGNRIVWKYGDAVGLGVVEEYPVDGAYFVRIPEGNKRVWKAQFEYDGPVVKILRKELVLDEDSHYYLPCKYVVGKINNIIDPSLLGVWVVSNLP